MEVGPGRASSAGRFVSDVLDAWVEQNLDTWAPSSGRDQQSRVRSIKKNPIAKLPVARLSVGDIERWHTRLRGAGMQDAGIKNQHGVLRAALSQAVRWGWVSTNAAGMAGLRSSPPSPALAAPTRAKSSNSARNARNSARRPSGRKPGPLPPALAEGGTKSRAARLWSERPTRRNYALLPCLWRRHAGMCRHLRS